MSIKNRIARHPLGWYFETTAGQQNPTFVGFEEKDQNRIDGVHFSSL